MGSARLVRIFQDDLPLLWTHLYVAILTFLLMPQRNTNDSDFTLAATVREAWSATVVVHVFLALHCRGQ